MKKTIYSIIAVIAIFILLGMAGTHDRAEQIIYNMPVELHRLIQQEMRQPSASDVKIAEYYLAHRKRLDSISEANGWL